MQLLKTCSKGGDCWKSFYMQVLQQRDFLIDEQKVNEPNPLYSLANIMKQLVT